MVKKRSRKARRRSRGAAESLGHVLGVLTSKVEDVNRQRAEVSKEIMNFVKSAQSMLSELGHRAALRLRKAPKVFPTRSSGKPGRKRGYKVSAAARRKMSLAAKRRWAAKRAEQKA